MLNSSENDKYLTKEEVKRLFSVIKSPRDRALFRVMYSCGLRATEPGQLQLSSYSPSEHRLFIRRLKGSLVSNPELPPDTDRALRRWIKLRGPAPGPLFLSNRNRGIGRAMVFFLVRQYAALAKIDKAKAHPHILKHSLGTHLLQAGVNLYTVKKLLGHKRITSTEQYLHLADAQVDDAAREFHSSW